MPLIISISASAAAIFSADDGCGRPPPNMNDILKAAWKIDSNYDEQWARSVQVDVKLSASCELRSFF